VKNERRITAAGDAPLRRPARPQGGQASESDGPESARPGSSPSGAIQVRSSDRRWCCARHVPRDADPRSLKSRQRFEVEATALSKHDRARYRTGGMIAGATNCCANGDPPYRGTEYARTGLQIPFGGAHIVRNTAVPIVGQSRSPLWAHCAPAESSPPDPRLRAVGDRA